MSRIVIDNPTSDYPFAHVEDSSRGIALGTVYKLKIPYKFSFDLANAEKVPIDGHNAFEDYWSTNSDQPELAIGMLGLFTNFMNSSKIYHLHPEVFSKFKGIKDMDTREIKHWAEKEGADQLIDIIKNSPDLYTDPQLCITQLNLLKTMLNEDQPNARNWHVDTDGIIKPIK